MAARRPTTLRWSEEAEAHHVREWAELERGALSRLGRRGVCAPPRRALPGWSAFLSWWLTLFGRQNSEIV
jgi:hypothetical protein